MKRRFLLPSFAVLFFLFSAPVAHTAQKNPATPADPSGTWRWEDLEGVTGDTNVLRLNLQKNGKVVGRFSGYGNKQVVIKNGRLQGNKLTFAIDLVVDGLKIHAEATATIKGDEMNIVSSYSGDEGGTSNAKATRSVLPMDVVGRWKLTFETPDGYLLEPTIVIEREKRKKLKGTYIPKDGESSPAKDVQLKENLLSVQVQIVHQGAPAAVKIVGRPYGRKMKGTLFYDYEGEIGEIPFEAQKVRTKKGKTKGKSRAKG